MPKIAIESIEPFVQLSKEDVSDSVTLYNTQAEMQLLSKLRSQSYRAYIAGLAALPDKDISEKMSLSEINIDRSEVALPVASLLPTQSQVFLDATVPKIKEDSIPSYFNDVVEVGIPIVTFNKRFVIDGHHRWLGAVMINPKAKISSIDFSSDELTPIQFLKLLQGAIVMEEGELPKSPKDEYEIDVFHASRKRIGEYIDEKISFEIKQEIEKETGLSSTEEVLTYLQQNIFSIKYNNLPAVSSPSRELMPQTNGKSNILDKVADSAPVMAKKEEN